MQSSSSQMPPVLPPSSVPAGLNALLSSGARKILVTRTFEDEADPAFRAAVFAPESGSGARPGGFVGASGVALAESGRRVVIVQAGTGHGARRGLRELLRDVYLNGLTGEPRAMFGIGDWLELLDAQECTGELEVREGDASIAMHIVRGSIRAIASPFAGGEERFTESALCARVSERLARILLAIHPDIRYTAGLAPPASASATGAASDMDDLLRGRLRSPFLERRIEDYQTPTAQPNLRVLAAGAGGPVTGLLRRPISNLLNRLARNFDVVLIDAPPVAVAGQAAILAGLADAALLVASVAAVRSAGLLHAVDELRRAGAASVAVHAVRTPTTLAPAQIR